MTKIMTITKIEKIGLGCGVFKDHVINFERLTLGEQCKIAKELTKRNIESVQISDFVLYVSCILNCQFSSDFMLVKYNVAVCIK